MALAITQTKTTHRVGETPLPQFSASLSALPNTILGLSLWLKADAITGLEDGDAVGQWDDSSGLAHHATQATGAAKPTYKTGIAGDHPALYFDGGDSLATASFNLGATNAVTVFVVARATGNVADAGIFNYNFAASGGIGLRQDFAGGGEAQFVYDNTANITGSVDLSTLGFQVLEIEKSVGGALKLRRNEALLGSAAHVFTLTASSAVIIGVAVGHFVGYITEIIAYNQVLTDAERQKITAYLSQKYQLGTFPDLPTVSAAWTASDGSVSPTPATTTTLTPTNETQSVEIGASFSGDTAETTIQIYATLNEIGDNFWGDWGFKQRKNIPAKVSVAEDQITQKVRYKGSPFPSFELTPTDRDLDTWEEVDAFIDFHLLHLPFYVEQPVTGELLKVVFDQVTVETAFNSHDSTSFPLLLKKYGGSL